MKILGRGSRQHAFTLVEIMVVVALIGLLAALAFPSFIKVRKQSQGRRIVNDARILDAAIDTWSLEQHKTDGDAVDVAAAAGYTKSGTISLTDVLGNAFEIGPVGPTQVVISVTTKTALAGVNIDWGGF